MLPFRQRMTFGKKYRNKAEKMELTENKERFLS